MSIQPLAVSAPIFGQADLVPVQSRVAGRREVYLYPGQVLAVNESSEVTVILSSGVAVSLWHPETGLFGVCHCPPLLVWMGEKPSAAVRANSALERLCSQLESEGADTRCFEARIYGGSHIQSSDGSAPKTSLGMDTVNAALKFLFEAGITVAGSEVGGSRSRKIHFDPTTGRARVQLL